MRVLCVYEHLLPFQMLKKRIWFKWQLKQAFLNVFKGAANYQWQFIQMYLNVVEVAFLMSL